MARPSATGRTRRMRIARFLAAAGVASRRACEDLVAAGDVAVNGVTIQEAASTVDPATDTVHLRGTRVNLPEPVYLLLHKPRGYTCSARDTHARRLAQDLLPNSFGRVFSVGRLDRDSEGLLLFTNDGDFAERLTHPRYQVPKTYWVWCDGDVSVAVVSRMRKGVHDEGEFLRPQRIRKIRPRPGGAVLEVVLTEGKKREVRRLCARQSLSVTRLIRKALGGVTVGDLQPGQWRPLTPGEVAGLLRAASPRGAMHDRLTGGPVPTGTGQ